MFGVAGAIIGAMPENKKIEKDLTFLIIQYSGEENKSKYIVLDASKFPEWADKLNSACGFKKENLTINL